MNAKSIKHLRIKLKCSQEELARILGITTAALSRWENGKASPSRKHNDRLVCLASHVEDTNIDALKKILRPGRYVGRWPPGQYRPIIGRAENYLQPPHRQNSIVFCNNRIDKEMCTYSNFEPEEGYIVSRLYRGCRLLFS